MATGIPGNVDTSATLSIFARGASVLAKVDNNRASGKTLLYGDAYHYASFLGRTPDSLPAGQSWCSNTSPHPIDAYLETRYANGARYCVNIIYPGTLRYDCV